MKNGSKGDEWKFQISKLLQARVSGSSSPLSIISTAIPYFSAAVGARQVWKELAVSLVDIWLHLTQLHPPP